VNIFSGPGKFYRETIFPSFHKSRKYIPNRAASLF
jgi:hypothetical protein